MFKTSETEWLNHERITSLVECIKTNLYWDLLEKVRGLPPEQFLVLIKRNLSPLIVSIILGEDKDIPLYMHSTEKWLRIISEWSYKQGERL